ncbi:MAG: hypothetical protein ACXVD1_05860 [Nocardioides sp.]
MSTITMKQNTTLTPEQYVAGLIDFGPGRSQLFANSADDALVVHGIDLAEKWADVTEGGGGVWERLRYDWSNPLQVVLTTTDSNTWGGASGHTYTFTPRADGAIDIELVTVREGKNLKGRMLGIMLGSAGKGLLTKAFEQSVAVLERRNSTAVSALRRVR